MQSGLMAENLAISPNVSFCSIGGHNALFDEADQKLFEINDTAAYIWCAVEDGLGHEAILYDLVGQGLAPEVARAYLEAALQQWMRLGFMRPALRHPAAALHSDRTCLHQDICVAGQSIRIRYATEQAAIIAPIFAHLENPDIAPEIVLDILELSGQFEFYRNGNWLLSCPHKEVATTLKGQLLQEVLDGASYELALHAAALVRNGRTLLVNGPPGVGKTTLSLALIDAGFGFAGDDLALLNSQGRVTGVPFASAVKAGAWKLAATYRPDIRDAPVFRRPDRRRVRYLTPQRPVPTTAYPVGWYVLLDRHSEGPAALTPLDPLSAIRWMLKEAYAPGRQLTATGFRAAAHAVGHAQYYRLTYSRLEDAVALLHRTCR